jgi:hypothetical protein
MACLKKLNLAILLLLGMALVPCYGQDVLEQAEDVMPTIGQKVPPAVRDMYRKGLQYLSEKQKEDGSWPTSSGFGSETAGVSAICTLAFLSAGEDPNFGRYAPQIRRGLRHIIQAQHPKSGLFEGNTYDYGFALLLLAEAYGAVDDTMLWAGYPESKKKRSIAEALELAVRAAIIPEKTERLISKTWYSTGSSPAQGIPDTSVAGSILVGLLAARNAGIEVPDDTIDKAIAYFEFMTNEDGTVGYMTNPASAYGNSIARSAICTLVLAMGKRKESPKYKACRDFIVDNIEGDYDTHIYYGRYYMAQALFQSDYDAWKKWNRMIITKTQNDQNDDGSLGKCQYGSNYSTGISLLSLALNFRILPVYER